MIGVFDSGLGGLSVLAAVARTLPRADLLYLADTAHVPYGPRSDAFIRGRVLAIGEHLASRGCHTIVVACNTATAAAMQALRTALPDIAVVGVEPGVKPAAASSLTRRIAVLATESTAQSARLQHLIERHASQVAVEVIACPGWATRVETLHPLDAGSDPEFARQVEEKILPLFENHVDRIVLGCTHYSFLAPLLNSLREKHRRPHIELIDVADAVARQVQRLAGPQAQAHARLTLLATARPERLHAALPTLGLHWLAGRVHEPAQLAMI